MKILVLGGRGFLGRSLCKALKKYDLYTFDTAQGPKNHRTGNILILEDLISATEDIHTIINLVGLSPLRKPRKTSYQEIHVQGVDNIIEAAKHNNIKKIIHISVLGADSTSNIEYLRTKAQAEQHLFHSKLPITILCPSLLWSEKSSLMNLLKGPFVPCIPAKFSPIHVEDVAKYIKLGVQGVIKEKRLELGGPQDLTIHQMAEKANGKGIPLPYWIVKFGTQVLAAAQLFGITPDQVKSLNLDNSLDDVRCFDYFKPRTFMGQ